MLKLNSLIFLRVAWSFQDLEEPHVFIYFIFLYLSVLMLGVTHWCYLSMLNLKSKFKQKDSYVLTMSNFRNLANLPPEFHIPSLTN